MSASRAVSSGLGGKPVAGAAHGLYQIFVGIAEGFAQAPDVHVDGALFNIDIAAPDLIQQLATGVGAFLVSHEELQQTVFGRAHLGGFAVDGHAVADRVQQQAADFDWRFAIGRAGAAQHGFEARHQLTGENGLVM